MVEKPDKPDKHYFSQVIQENINSDINYIDNMYPFVMWGKWYFISVIFLTKSHNWFNHEKNTKPIPVEGHSTK